MEMIPVSSSNIDSIGHDSDASVLRVMFKDGSVYEYLGVSNQVFQAFLQAGSKGQFLDREIKKGGYSFRKVSG